jgi:hypothetical protein
MTDEPDIDINLCFLCSPPLVIPVSDRAKARMCLPDGVEAALFLEDPAENVLDIIAADGDWMIATTDDLPSNELIKLMSIKVLH